jgi:hypothetical protein
LKLHGAPGVSRTHGTRIRNASGHFRVDPAEGLPAIEEAGKGILCGHFHKPVFRPSQVTAKKPGDDGNGKSGQNHNAQGEKEKIKAVCFHFGDCFGCRERHADAATDIAGAIALCAVAFQA